MPFRTFAFACIGVSIVTAACTSRSDEIVEISADELAAMAIPGVDESALDRRVDPCDDFYAFACGGYVARLPADTQRETRAFSQLQKDRDAILAQVIEEIGRSPRTEAERKATQFYGGCMATDGVSESERAFLRGFRAELEAATSGAEIARVLARMHRRRQSAFFAFFPTSDTVAQGRHGSAAVFPSGYDFRTDYGAEEGRAARAKAIVDSVRRVEPSIGDAEVSRLAEAAVGVERAIAAAAAAVRPDEPAHPVGRHGLETAAPGIDWSAYFGAFGDADLGPFPVSGLGYFAALDTILSTTSVADLHAYLTARWYSAKASAPTAPGTEASSRAATCTDAVVSYMSDAIEPRFLERAGVDARARAKANALWRAITDAFGDELVASTFLDVPTRVEAKIKLDEMRAAIGGSHDLDDFADLSVDAKDSFAAIKMRLLEREFDRGVASIGKPLPLLHVDFPAPFVNASYDGSLNKINVPGGILGGYFFSPVAPNLANFAAIGTVLGHELTHGFDTQGRLFDGKGVSRDWWSPEVDAAFHERAACMVDQYGAFALDGVTDPVTGTAPAHVDGRRTIGENIADNGGVKTAYRAAKVEERTGPVAFGFTPAQQFFIGYGQLWCAKVAPAVASQLLARDPHSPAQARVNVPLSNFDKFASAFQCKTGRAMAPQNRCGVW